MIWMFRRPSGYPSKPVLDPRAYMLSLLKRRELRGQWQRACELLRAEADVAELTKALELALFWAVETAS